MFRGRANYLSMLCSPHANLYSFTFPVHVPPSSDLRYFHIPIRFQEEFMNVLNHLHFEKGSSGESACSRSTLLKAAAEVDLVSRQNPLGFEMVEIHVWVRLRLVERGLDSMTWWRCAPRRVCLCEVLWTCASQIPRLGLFWPIIEGSKNTSRSASLECHIPLPHLTQRPSPSLPA